MKAQWLNLTGYGLDLKRVELNNGLAFIAVIVTDTEKYKSSGATPLNRLSVANETGIRKLPGERKGRGFNTPVLYLTNSFEQNGNAEYRIIPQFAKLLNVDEQTIRSHVIEVDHEDILVKNSYADFDKFNRTVDEINQAYYGNTIYVTKSNPEIVSLRQLASELDGQAHPLFPKATAHNLPLELMDSLNMNSTIVQKAFLNPDDALKAGYKLDNLERLTINGENSILPISLNRDLSINFIGNLSAHQMLAYSNYNWKKNGDLISDYNALVSIREMGREVLNARTATINEVGLMENHLEKMSSALKNFNSVNSYGRTHSSIKIDKDQSIVLIAKNTEGQWRYIEKNYTSKIDQPLNWENYSKALTKLGVSTMGLTSLLKSEPTLPGQFDSSMKVALNNHSKIFNAFVEVVPAGAEPKKDNLITVRVDSNKLTPSDIKANTTNHERSIGQELYTESVKRLIGELEQIPSGSLESQFASNSPDVDISNPVSMEPSIDDVMLDALDNVEISTPPIPLKGLDTSVLTSENEIGKYKDLPRGISPEIDAGYERINDIYRTLQDVELSVLPYLNQLKSNIEQMESENSNELAQEFAKQVDAALKGVTIDSKPRTAGYGELISTLNDAIYKETVKSNILKYQFGKFTNGKNIHVHGLLAFNSVDGQFAPFENRNDYQLAVEKIKEANLKNNVENGFEPLATNTRKMVDAFVAQHYSIDSAPNVSIDQLLEQSALILNQYRSTPNDHFVQESLPFDHSFNSYLNEQIITITENGLNSYSQSADVRQIDLDLQLLSSLRNSVLTGTGVDIASDDSTQIVLEAFKNRPKGYMGVDYSAVYPDTHSPIDDHTKIAALSSMMRLAISNSDLSNNEKFEKIEDVFELQDRAIEQYHTRINMIDPAQFQTELAGKFLLNNQDLSIQSHPDSKIVVGYYFDVDGAEPFKVKPLLGGNEQYGLRYTSVGYNEAVSAAFNEYQINTIGTMIGLKAHEIAKALEISKQIRLSGQSSIATKDINSAFNDSMLWSDQKLNNATGFVAALSGVSTDVNYPSVIDSIKTLEHFKVVQKYIEPDIQEQAHMLSLAQDLKNGHVTLTDLASKSSEYAIEAHRNNSVISANETKYNVITSIPFNENDVLYSRIVPESWTKGFNGVFEKRLQYSNLSFPLNTSDIESKTHILKMVSSNLTEISPFSVGISTPKFGKSSVGFNMTDAEISALSNGTQGNSILEAAKLNFTQALRDMPESLKKEFSSMYTGESDGSSYIYITAQKLEAYAHPILRIHDQNSPVEPGEVIGLYAPAITLGQIMGRHPGVRIDINNPQFGDDAILLQSYKNILANARMEPLFLNQNPTPDLSMLQGVKLHVDSINANSLLVLRQSFIDQLKDISNLSISETQVIDAAHLYVLKENSGDIHFAVSNSQEQSAKLLDQSYIAIGSKDENNLLGHLSSHAVKKEHKELETLISQFKSDLVQMSVAQPIINGADMEQPRANSIGVLDTFVSHEDASKSLEEQRLIDEITSNAKVDETVYPEKLAHYSLSEISLMSPSQISSMLGVKELWPDAPMNEHIAAGHQHLDTLILSKVLKGAIDDGPNYRDDMTVETSAQNYYFAVSEIYKAVSNATTPSELMQNYNKAYMNIVAFDPEFLNSGTRAQSDILKTFKKASHLHVNEGLPATEALKQGLATSDYFIDKFSREVAKLNEQEKLYTGDVSFIKYFDGFSYPEQADRKDLNAALTQRFGELSQPNVPSYPPIDGVSPKLYDDYLALIDAKTTVDFDKDKAILDLKSKWDVELITAPVEKYTQGYANILNEYLENISSKFEEGNNPFKGLVFKTPNSHSKISVPGITIPYPTDDKEVMFNKLSENVHRHITSSVINHERAAMTNQELAIVSNELDSKDIDILDLAIEGVFTPKTPAFVKMIEAHNSLKSDVVSNLNPIDELKFKAQEQANKLLSTYNSHFYDDSLHPTALFIRHLTNNAIKKQDAALAQIESKIKKIEEKYGAEPDLYSFKVIAPMIEKISNPSYSATTSVVESFVDNNMSAKKSERDMLVTLLKDKTESQVEMIGDAKAVLASRATQKVIDMMAEHSSLAKRDPEAFNESLRRDFGTSLYSDGLESNSDAYKSNYARQFVNELGERDRTFTKQWVVENYLYATLKMDASQELQPQELSNGLKYLGEITQLHLEQVQPRSEAVEASKKLDSRNDYGFNNYN